MRTSLKILVVDDDDSLRTAMSRLLRASGFTNVVSANDGDVALERLLVDGGYDLVITDFNMPKMNGLQLLKAVRQSEQLRHIKVVMVTGMGNLDGMRTAGADAAFRKPFRFEDLEVKLAELFP